MEIVAHIVINVFAYFIIHGIVWGFLAVFVYDIPEEDIDSDNINVKLEERLNFITRIISIALVILLNIFIYYW